MLSASQVEQYREEGYVVPDFRLPDETVDAIRVHHEFFLESHPEFVDYCPALLIHDVGFLNYARNDEILESEFFRQAGSRRNAHSVAPGWRILADEAARDLFGMDRNRRRNP